MIVKKITRRGGAGGGAERRYARTVARYIVRAGKEEVAQLLEVSDDDHVRSLAHYVLSTGREEKVLASGQFNLVSEDLEGWTIEVDALRQRSGRTTPCTDHWVLSWRCDDQPAVWEMTEAARIFLESQGLERCPVIWAVHDDTDNPHLHMMITRVDRLSGNVVAAGQRWDIDCAHRAVARIHAAFPNWTAEPHALYRVNDGRLVHSESGADVGPADDPKQWKRTSARARSDFTIKSPLRLDHHALDYEASTGWKSHQRVALEEAVPIMLASNSWREAQIALGKIGIGIERTRAGGNFVLGDTRVALGGDRRTTFGKLKKLFGSDEITLSPGIIHEYQPRPLSIDPRLIAYHAARREHEAIIKSIRGAVAMVHVMAGLEPRLARKVATVELSDHAFPFPTFDAWCAGALPAPVAMGDFGVVGFAGRDPAQVTSTANMAIGPFIGLKRRDGVHYRLVDNPAGKTAFIDTGKLLLSDNAVDDAALAAMLVIAQARWPGNVQAFGDAAFRERAERLADQLGMPLKNTADPSTSRAQMPIGSSVAEDSSHTPVSAAGRQKVADPDLAARKRMALIGRLFHGDWDPRDYFRQGCTAETIGMGAAKRAADPEAVDANPTTKTDLEATQRDAAARAAANAIRNGMSR